MNEQQIAERLRESCETGNGNPSELRMRQRDKILALANEIDPPPVFTVGMTVQRALDIADYGNPGLVLDCRDDVCLVRFTSFSATIDVPCKELRQAPYDMFDLACEYELGHLLSTEGLPELPDDEEYAFIHRGPAQPISMGDDTLPWDPSGFFAVVSRKKTSPTRELKQPHDYKPNDLR